MDLYEGRRQGLSQYQRGAARALYHQGSEVYVFVPTCKTAVQVPKIAAVLRFLGIEEK